MFSFDSMIRGYHEYMKIWNNPVAREELPCSRELGNSHDPYAIAVKKFKKMIGGEERVVGHVPRRISAICSLFIRRGGDIRCQVTGDKRYSADLPQGSLEIPAVLIFMAAKNSEGKKAKKLIENTLGVIVTVSEVDESLTSSSPVNSSLIIESVNKHKPTSQTASDNVESVINLIEPESDTEPPVAKKTKVIDVERIIMGQQLSDVEINFAQQLLKEQFSKINGLICTLYQEKKIALSEISVQNKLYTDHILQN